MKSWMLVSVAAFAVGFGTLSMGCSADVDSMEEDAAEEDLSKRQLSGVVAVEVAKMDADTVESDVTIGAPKKVKRLIAAVTKRPKNSSVPRCMEAKTTRLTFLDNEGKELATVRTFCAGYGGISFESGKEGFGVMVKGDVVDEIGAAPLAVGDALWGISKIQLEKRGASRTTLTGAAAKPVLDGFDLDEVPDVHASFPRCMPNYSVSFVRGKDQVALATFLCGAGEAPSSVKAQFSTVKPGTDTVVDGGISIDPRPILAALNKN